MSNSVADRVIGVIAHNLGFSTTEVKPEHSLADDLDADSLDCIEILMSIEEEFDIAIHDDDAMTVTTVQDAINLVNKLF